MELIIDVTEHDNPFDKAIMGFSEIVESSPLPMEQLLDEVEIHGLSISESAAFYAHIQTIFNDSKVKIIIGEDTPVKVEDFITIKGSRRHQQRIKEAIEQERLLKI